MDNQKKLYRISSAASTIGIAPGTLRRWVREGQVPVAKTCRGRWFWTPQMIEQIKIEMGIVEPVGAR